LGVTNVDWVYVSIVVGVVAVGKKAIGKEREQDEFWQCQELVPRQRESRSPASRQYRSLWWGKTAIYLSSNVMFSSEPPSELMGGPALDCDT
jgi:hypothetical protein